MIAAPMVEPPHLAMIARLSGRGFRPRHIREALDRLYTVETIETVISLLPAPAAPRPARASPTPAPPLPYRTIIVRPIPGDPPCDPPRTISAADIVNEVADRHGMTRNDLMSASRGRRLVRVRQEAMFEI
ncbi:MAG: hypothetical protein J0H54_09990, partial [Rhizobiales bacterium]|nr:hypothetical protein [Hyphomicrobiales bacterium]